MVKHNVFERTDTTEQKALLVQLLEKEPPYKAIEFDYKWYINFSFIENICIDDYCQKCDGEKVFSNEVKEDFKEI